MFPEPDPPQSPPSPQLTQSAEEARFDHVALLMGRPLYWNSAPIQHSTAVKTLLNWCLGLPGARLGVSPSGVAQIIQSTFASSSEQPSTEEVALLARFGTRARSAIDFYPDVLVWHEHLNRMLDWLREVSQVNDYIWLDSQDSRSWIESTSTSLKTYTDILDTDSAGDVLLQLMSRHDCTLFAPFDGPAMWDQFASLVAALPPDQQPAYQQMLVDPQFSREQLSRITGTFWSWRILNFGSVGGSIISTPLLGLWNDYPSSHVLAPPAPEVFATRPRFTAAETVRILDNIYWQVLETLFNAVRLACGLGVAEPEFNGIESRPPVFFYAAPTSSPLAPQAYVTDLSSTIRPLVKSCLLTDDPLSDQVAWGVLAGDLVTLRHELSHSRSYQSRYLLLPTVATSSTTEPIEDKLGTIADLLTYLEFSVGHETRDVYTDMDPLSSRSATWGGTLDSMEDLTSEGMELLPRRSRASRLRIRNRLAQLRTTLQRLQVSIEKGATSVNGVEQSYKNYIDGTDDFIRRTITSSIVSNVSVRSLSEAIKSAYPYTYLKQPLQSLHDTVHLLRTSAERVNSLIDTVLEQADRLERDRLTRLGETGGVLLILVGIIGFLPQFVNAQPESAQPYTPTTLPSLIADYISPQGLHLGARILLILFGIVLVVSVSVYTYTWITQSLLRPRVPLNTIAVQFREIVDKSEPPVSRARAYENDVASALTSGSTLPASESPPAAQSSRDAASAVWRQVDHLDEQATKMLSSLWKQLSELAGKIDRRGRRGSHAWETRTRILEHLIEIFDFAPQTIPLPRTLCILRFKSTDFRIRTTVSNRDFERSLGGARFAEFEVRALNAWLSEPGNIRQIREWDVATFARILRERGVSADPQKRTPDKWQGSLTSPTYLTLSGSFERVDVRSHNNRSRSNAVST